MFDLQVLNPDERIIFVLLELELPVIVEVLHVLVADSLILYHLSQLDVCTELILITDNFSFQEAHFFHQVLVKLILVDLAAL